MDLTYKIIHHPHPKLRDIIVFYVYGNKYEYSFSVLETGQLNVLIGWLNQAEDTYNKIKGGSKLKESDLNFTFEKITGAVVRVTIAANKHKYGEPKFVQSYDVPATGDLNVLKNTLQAAEDAYKLHQSMTRMAVK